MTREEAITRIRALRARAADEASSESEAAAAAARAAKIIAEHQVTEEDLIERGTSGVTEGSHDTHRRTMHPVLDTVGEAIALLTECRWLIRRGEHTWVGQPEDVEFALYLCEMIQGASQRAYRRHAKRNFTSAPSAKYRRSFMMGFGDRVFALLIETAKSQRAARAAAKTGTDVAVVKSAIIKSYMDETYPLIRERKQRAKQEPDVLAYLSGHQAGGGVQIARPISDEQNANMAEIGRG